MAHVPDLDAAKMGELHHPLLAARPQHPLLSFAPDGHLPGDDVHHVLEHGLAAAPGEGLVHAHVHAPRPIHLPDQVTDGHVGEAGAGAESRDHCAAGLPGSLVTFVQDRLGGAPVVADAGVVDARLDGCPSELGLEAEERPQGGSGDIVALHRLDEGAVVVRVDPLDVHRSSLALQRRGDLVGGGDLAVSDGHLVDAGRAHQVLDSPAAHVSSATENDDPHVRPPSA